MRNVLTIADIGANHNGDLDTAIEMIRQAAACGMDVAKFQLYDADSLYCKKTKNFAQYKNVHSLIKKCELPVKWLPFLKNECERHDIEFMASAFSLESINRLRDLGVKRLKIAGFEATDPRLVKHAAKQELPLIISTGIGCDLDMVKKITGWVMAQGCNSGLTFLHANHAYPTPARDTNLQVIKTLRDSCADWIDIGYSDHTTDIVTPALAVAYGATVIEKHFTLNRLQDGPDHPFALEPQELLIMQELINHAVLTSGSKYQTRVTASEQRYTPCMRSVVPLVDLKAGEFLTQHNTTTKRPYIAGAVKAECYEDVCGCQLLNDVFADTPLLIEDVEYDRQR